MAARSARAVAAAVRWYETHAIMIPLSIIIPALNEAGEIVTTLQRLQPWRARGVEVILADGGSDDLTRELATPLVDQVIRAPRGRAAQMNAGASRAGGARLLFLHADTLLPDDPYGHHLATLSSPAHAWGWFAVRIAGHSPLLPVVATMMNVRSRLTRIATGDQTIFVDGDLFRRVGGFPELPLMEDIALCRHLRRIAPPCCLASPVTTSGRRWEQRGAVRTILLMWGLRLAYFVGVAPARLARWYGEWRRVA